MNNRYSRILLLGLLSVLVFPRTLWADDLTHGFVDSDGVKIHYVTQGEGPLVVMLHGFPDFWYTWRKQIPAIAQNYQVVAIDLRGYNKSDQPEGVEQCLTSSLLNNKPLKQQHKRTPLPRSRRRSFPTSSPPRGMPPIRPSPHLNRPVAIPTPTLMPMVTSALQMHPTPRPSRCLCSPQIRSSSPAAREMRKCGSTFWEAGRRRAHP